MTTKNDLGTGLTSYLQETQAAFADIQTTLESGLDHEFEGMPLDREESLAAMEDLKATLARMAFETEAVAHVWTGSPMQPADGDATSQRLLISRLRDQLTAAAALVPEVLSERALG